MLRTVHMRIVDGTHAKFCAQRLRVMLHEIGVIHNTSGARYMMHKVLNVVRKMRSMRQIHNVHAVTESSWCS